MSKNLSILYVAPEVYPFAKESGIADVAFSLPIAIRDIGHDIRVMLPKYGTISERKNKIHEINRLRNIPIMIGEVEQTATVKSSSIQNPRTKVQAYVTTNTEYYDGKKGIYHDPNTWEEYEDNAERFIFFNKSVIETCLILGWFPDIIHINNWQTALIPAMAKELYPEQFKNTRFVLTIHNFYSPGSFDMKEFQLMGLPDRALPNLKHNDQINFLKAGIIYSDFVTTVSKTYAEEILEDEKSSNGLNKVLQEHKDKFKGILNGTDNWTWNPEKDKVIKSQYKGNFEEYKYNNKVELITKFDFDFKPKAPLIGMIPNIGYQKGVPLLLEIADELFKEDVQFLLLGQGKAELKAELQKVADKYPEKFKVKFDFDQDLSRQMEAGCDIFLMPSEYEPCGLNLIYSLLYGTVPVIRHTGGMKEISTPVDENAENGNTFVFENYDAQEFLATIKKAVEVFKDQDKWMKIVKHGMEQEFGWKERAQEYSQIYLDSLSK